MEQTWDAAQILQRLRQPEGTVDVVLDTDTYNEADDQFALSYLVRSNDRLRVRGLYAAPFYNNPERAASPAEGMERSYREILTLLKLLGREDLNGCVRRGSAGYLPSETEPLRSEAAEDLIRLAMEHTPDDPLYVVCIACITNLASALLLEPRIRERIVTVWLGGHALEWPDTEEFNLRQDVAAARVVMASQVPLVLLPCRGVVSAFTITKPETEYWLRGKNALCDYLADELVAYTEARNPYPTWSKPLWDVTAVAWLLGGFMKSRIETCPVPEYDFRWGRCPTNHPIRYVYHIERDKLLLDLIEKLTKQP